MSVGDIKTKSFYEEAPPNSEGTLTTFGAVLGIISTILGGGMIAIPFAIYCAGFGLGLCISAFAAIQVIFSSVMYLKAREVCPN